MDQSISANGPTRDGRFELKGLTAGRYVVHAIVGHLAMMDDGRRDKRNIELGETAVEIDSNEVANVMVATAKAATVSGRVFFEGGPPRSPAQLHMVGQLVRRNEWWAGEPPMSAVDDRLTFHFAGVYPQPSTLVFQGLPEGWVVKSIRLGDRDVTNMATDYTAGGPGSVQIVLTNHVAHPIVRVVRDPNVADSCRPILMSADPRLRNLVAADTPGRDGLFKLGPTLPGEYLLVALTTEDLGILYRDLERLDDLAPLAQRVTLVEGKDQTFDVKVVTLPPRR